MPLDAASRAEIVAPRGVTNNVERDRDCGKLLDNEMPMQITSTPELDEAGGTMFGLTLKKLTPPAATCSRT